MCLCPGLLISTTNARAAEFLLFGIFGISQQSTTSGGSTTTSDGHLGWGGGVALGLDLSSWLRVQINANYLRREFGIGASDDQTQGMHAVQFPLLVRAFFGDFSLGGGFSLDYGFGGVSRNNGGTITEQTYAAAGYNPLGGGIVGAVGYTLPQILGLRFHLEGRYFLDLLERSSVAGVQTRFTDIQALFGVRFGGGSEFGYY